jgi:hypothetical protein
VPVPPDRLDSHALSAARIVAAVLAGRSTAGAIFTMLG